MIKVFINQLYPIRNMNIKQKSWCMNPINDKKLMFYNQNYHYYLLKKLKDQKTNENQTVLLDCQVNRQPKSSPIWYSDGK